MFAVHWYMMVVPTAAASPVRPFRPTSEPGRVCDSWTVRRYFHPDTDDIRLPGVLFALSDATRIGIVVALSDGSERTAGDLGGDIAKSTMTHHLKILREAGVLRVRSEGTRCYNSLRLDDLEDRFPGLLKQVLSSAARDGYAPADAHRQGGGTTTGVGSPQAWSAQRGAGLTGPA